MVSGVEHSSSMKDDDELLFSIIVPCHNCEDTIHRCIKSVLSQAGANFELILIDDASTDGTAETIKLLCNEHPVIRYYRKAKNSGVSSARNLGIKKASGKWIAFLDADDFFTGQYLEECAKFLYDADFVVTSYIKLKFDSETSCENHGLVSKQVLDDDFLLDYTENYFRQPYNHTLLMHCWNKFFKAELLKQHRVEFDERLSQLEDLKFVCDYLCVTRNKRKFLPIPGITNIVHQAGDNLSSRSGLGSDNVASHMIIALSSAEKFRGLLEKNCSKSKQIPFGHFVSSMVVLFCFRITRKFRREKTLATLWRLWGLLCDPILQPHLSQFLYVNTESRLVHFFVTKVPAFLRPAVFLFVKR